MVIMFGLHGSNIHTEEGDVQRLFVPFRLQEPTPLQIKDFAKQENEDRLSRRNNISRGRGGDGIKGPKSFRFFEGDNDGDDDEDGGVDRLKFSRENSEKEERKELVPTQTQSQENVLPVQTAEKSRNFRRRSRQGIVDDDEEVQVLSRNIPREDSRNIPREDSRKLPPRKISDSPGRSVSFREKSFEEESAVGKRDKSENENKNTSNSNSNSSGDLGFRTTSAYI